jgi:prolyl-tRNA synthetase
MHDLYSFDVGPEAAQVSYDLIYNAYLDIFRRVGIPILPIPSVDTGEIGGDNSHEFICLTPTGESVVWVSPNKEQARLGEAGGCQVEANWHQEKGLELAHTFQLGYQYTKPLDVLFVDRDGSRHNIYMCSFGLGVERTIAALLEVGLTRGPQFSWPWSIAPYHVNIIVASPTAHLDAATAFANELDMVGIRTIVDDRDTRVGSKFNDSQLLGAPIDLVFGSNYPDVEVIDRIAGEKVIASREDALAIIQKAWREAVS